MAAQDETTIDVGATFTLNVKVGTFELHGSVTSVMPNSDFNAVASNIGHAVEVFAGAVWSGIDDAAQFSWNEASGFGEQIWHVITTAFSSDAVGVHGHSPTSAGYVSLNPAALALIKDSHF